MDRKTVFTFDPGRPVFELTDPDGRRWVMQTRSDAHVAQDDLGNNYSLVR